MLNRASLFFPQPQRPAQFKLSLAARNLQRPDYIVESLLTWDYEGNTPLHYAIRNCTDANEIKLFLEKRGRDSASAMARIVNDKGQLPIDLVKDMKLDEDSKQKLYSMLSPPTTTNSLKKLSDFIDSKEVLNSYHFSPNSEIYKNLQIACSVVNESRKAIKESATHPHVNNWSAEEKNILANKINRMRYIQILDQLTVIVTNPIGMLIDTQNTFNEKMAERPLQNGLGNCGEFAFVAWHFLRKQDRNLSADFYSIKNGDHAFIVIGEGNNAVVCDAWAGEVYPAYEIPRKLGCYRQYPAGSSYLNVVTSYNQNFHSAGPDFMLKLNNFCYKLLIAGLGIFAASRVCDALTTNIGSAAPQIAPK